MSLLSGLSPNSSFIILNCIMLPGNPPLYKVKNLKTGEIPNTLFTNEQLQII